MLLLTTPIIQSTAASLISFLFINMKRFGGKKIIITNLILFVQKQCKYQFHSVWTLLKITYAFHFVYFAPIIDIVTEIHFITEASLNVLFNTPDTIKTSFIQGGDKFMFRQATNGTLGKLSFSTQETKSSRFILT